MQTGTGKRNKGEHGRRRRKNEQRSRQNLYTLPRNVNEPFQRARVCRTKKKATQQKRKSLDEGKGARGREDVLIGPNNKPRLFATISPVARSAAPTFNRIVFSVFLSFSSSFAAPLFFSLATKIGKCLDVPPGRWSAIRRRRKLRGRQAS